jgi:glycosyltransferase involved in cell wall biosynthesis
MTICFEPLIEAGLRFARRRGLPFVSYPLTHLGAGSRPGADALSRFYTMRHQVALVRESDAAVVQTATESNFYASLGMCPERLVVGGPGVTPATVLGGDGVGFRQRHDLHGPVVVSLATMSYDKGTIHLVEAVRRLWREGRQVDLVLAGAVLAPFQHYLAALPEADARRLKVLGPVDDAEKRDMLAAADIFAMPSRTDSFGIVYLEAWLYRLPVIAARTWGMGDVVRDGEDGLLVAFGDVPALVQALGRLLDHPEERMSLGVQGEQKVYRQYTWEHRYAPVRDLYARLIENGR